MNPLAFALAGYAALVLQLGLAGRLGWGAWQVSLPLLLAVFVSLHAARPAALVGAALLGFGADAVAGASLGSGAFGYGLAALLILKLRFYVDRDHPLTHAILTLVSGALVALSAAVLLWTRGWFHGPATLALGPVPGARWGDALLTAAVAPVALWALARVRKAFGFRSDAFEH